MLENISTSSFLYLQLLLLFLEIKNSMIEKKKSKIPKLKKWNQNSKIKKTKSKIPKVKKMKSVKKHVSNYDVILLVAYYESM